MKSLGDLQSEAADAVHRYVAGTTENPTATLREVAEALVDAREHFVTKEGDADWLGRTGAYRRWVSDTYTLGNVPREALGTIQAAVRYHAGNALRDRLDNETLHGLGLLASGPKKRKGEQRDKTNETLTLFAGGASITDTGEILNLARLAERAFRRLSLLAIAEAPEEVKPEIRSAMEAVYTLAGAAAKVAASRPE